MLKRIMSLLLGIAALPVISADALAQDSELNPLTLYVLEGKPIRPWTLAIGDHKSHYTPFTGMKTASRSKKVSVEQTQRNRSRDAVAIKWTGKKGYGSFAVGGFSVDLSALEEEVALAIDMRKDGKIAGGLGVSMMCEHPCRGAVNIRPLIENFRKGEWFTLPIPLTCFSNAGADLSKIDTPFHIESHGRAKLSISHVRLVKLPESYRSMCPKKVK